MTAEDNRAPSPLTIELVPASCWFTNVRSQVSTADWERLRKQTAAAAGHRCEICGGQGPKWPVECHEMWHYDLEQRVQKLVRLIALCPACHEVKHLGLAETRGRLRPALEHLARINGWTLVDAQTYAEAVFEIWGQRSRIRWTLDLQFLDDLKIPYTQARR